MRPLASFEQFVRESEPLAMHTWFQLGGPAKFFAEPENIDQLTALVRRCYEEDLPVRMLGEGSNVLVREEGFSGVVIRLTAPAFCGIRVAGQTLIVGGGALLGRAITAAVHHGLAGLETFVGIPGTVGGALRSNTGPQGTNLGQWELQADVLTSYGEVTYRSGEEMVFDRGQGDSEDLAILEVRCRLEEDNPRELAARMQKHWIARKGSQPPGHQAAGYIFRNPRGGSAGELIERAGLKGTRIGGATLCERHANFIIAEPDCTSQDVLRLIELVRNQVRNRLGVELELGLEIW